jgi:hypothetical protein
MKRMILLGRGGRIRHRELGWLLGGFVPASILVLSQIFPAPAFGETSEPLVTSGAVAFMEARADSAAFAVATGSAGDSSGAATKTPPPGLAAPAGEKPRTLGQNLAVLAYAEGLMVLWSSVGSANHGAYILAGLDGAAGVSQWLPGEPRLETGEKIAGTLCFVGLGAYMISLGQRNPDGELGKSLRRPERHPGGLDRRLGDPATRQAPSGCERGSRR